MLVKDEHLTRLLFAIALKSLEQGKLNDLLEMGFRLETLDELRQLPASQLEKLCSMNIVCSVKLDDASVALAIDTLLGQQRTTEKLEYFVRHRAPANLIIRLFKISASALQNIRNSVCPPDARGRNTMPPEQYRESIQSFWREIEAQSQGQWSVEKERDDWIRLHQKFQEYSIGSLYNVIHEFSDVNEKQ